jgi:hypothetical protein
MSGKNILKIAIPIIFVLIAVNLSYAKSWHFTEWATDITINSDKSIIVHEKFTVDFVPAIGFIRRNIDIKSSQKIKNVKVYDESLGELGEDEANILYDTDKVRIKLIAKPQNEKKTWIIEYNVNSAIDFAKPSDDNNKQSKNASKQTKVISEQPKDDSQKPKDIARLRWGIVSSDRQTTIDKIEAVVHLPQAIQNEKLKLKLSIGIRGYESPSLDYEIANSQSLRFWGTDIGAYEDFTIQVEMPKNIFVKLNLMKFYICSLIPLLTLIGFFWKWWSGNRKPAIKNRVLQSFQSPEGISPINLYALIYGEQSLWSIIAILIELANRNYIKIINEGKKDAQSLYSNYNIRIQDDYENRPTLKDYELKLLKQLFNSEKTVTLDKLKNGLYRSVSNINNAIWGELVREKYISTDPRDLKRRCTIIGVIIFALGGMSVLLYKPIGLALVLTGFIIVVFGRRIFPITSKGRKMRLQGLGFRKFMIDESKSDDQADARLFFSYLPYAILFDMEKDWIKRSANVLKRHPYWYIPNGEEPFSAILDFIAALTSIIAGLSSKKLGK